MTPKRKGSAREARPTLPQLCSEAADHVARARVALYDETFDAEEALQHMEEAISCLRRLLAHGLAAQANGSRANLRSA